MRIVDYKNKLNQWLILGKKGGLIDTSHLVAALEDSSEDVRNITKRLKKTEDEKLDVALEDVAAERVTRAAGYTRVSKDIAIWDSVVHSRRAADTLSFPLKNTDLR